MTDALSGAAVAIVNALSNKENSNGLQKAAESTHHTHDMRLQHLQERS